MSSEKRKREEEDEKSPDQSATNEKPAEKKRRSNKETNGTSTDTIQCSICLDTVCCTNRKSLPCTHAFHEICINKWLERSGTCPICRSSAVGMNDILRTGTNGSRLARWHTQFLADIIQLHDDIDRYGRDRRREYLERINAHLTSLDDILTQMLIDLMAHRER
ncbi:hypothetical protein AVEN_214051-1 [Araneus ventricosus]|uniref:RING-type E3 ubiquitin transferase n=2 Tax=Araneus ventricosus TaxID=182803 RepID=A0A4Y2N3G0_ARAVE|nr:hypothetical protein AVEN_159395-1 [Araneus ventricosus]GBN33130.1 hypothetical protein AVEN_166034-1 [Araneus ventricosus]GBN33131.1 hypothetical protein AVEN_166035-1 [Araneus ventricosus]GBN33150.1 hypothetical protein AVEN_214051-1 [Araneus ventricosus]